MPEQLHEHELSEEQLNENLRLFFSRSSVRNYTKQKISAKVINKLLQAALQAPTSSHVQAFCILNVTNTELRAKFVELCGKQNWISEASHFLILCADLNKIATFSSLDVTSSNISQDTYLASLLDGALVGMTLSLAAEALEIGSVMIGSVRNSVEETSRLLKLPKGVMPLFGLCLGYYSERKKPKPRLPSNLFVFENEYELPNNSEELLNHYHEDLAKYYKENTLEHSGLRTSNSTWLQVVTSAVQNTKRMHMGSDLKNRGFDLSTIRSNL